MPPSKRVRFSDDAPVANGCTLLDQKANTNIVFSHDEILDILGHLNGSNIIDAVALHGPDLLSFGFTKNDIFKLIGSRDPVGAIEALAAHGMELIFILGYKKTALLNTIFYEGGHTALTSIAVQQQEIRRAARAMRNKTPAAPAAQATTLSAS